MEKELRSYYCRIRRCLPCPGKLKKQIMDNIQSQVNAYLEENPTADFASVRQHFGTPQQIASAYIDEMTTAEILKRFKLKKTVITALCIIAAIVAAIWITAVAEALKSAKNSVDGYYEVGEIVVEEEVTHK